MGNYNAKEGDTNEESNVGPHHSHIPPKNVARNNTTVPNAYSSYLMSLEEKKANNQNNDDGQKTESSEILSYQDDSENIVPIVFRWEHGGKNVYITGTFNNWEKQIPMHRSGNDFTYLHNLRRGKHAYKFIVDDEWRFAPDQPTVPDIEGRMNNFIDVSDFQPYMGDKKFFLKSKECKVPLEDFHQNVPDMDEYTKDPPTLPPHLRHIILNKPSPTSDPLSLPAPQLVALHHLYCTAIKDNVMVLGATKRYKDKSITFVYYSMMPGTSVLSST